MQPQTRARFLATGLLVACFGRAAEAQVTHPFPGVTLVRNPSRAMAVVNLCAAGVSVRATQYAERMATPQQWAQPRGLEVAINADFFDFPGWTYVVGRARGQGHDWPAADQNRESRPYWQFGPHMAVEEPNGATAPDPAATDIVGGHDVLMTGGHSSGPWTGDADLLNTLHNRTAIGISADHLTLFLLSTNNAIDAATTVTYLIHDAAEAGATVDYATMQDGGGSSQMYVAGLGQIVTSGRQVNNHLGIDANGGMAAPTNCTAHYAAVFHAQSFPYASVGPVMVAVGQDSPQWIELTNAGTLPWMPGQTFLAPTPRDMPSAVGGAAWVSPTRVSTVTTMVPPGGVYRFPLVFTGTRTGDFTQTFGMVQEGVTWFSTAPLGGGPPDDQIEAHVVVTPGTLDAGRPDGAMADAAHEPPDAQELPDGFVTDSGGGRDARADGGLGAEGSEHADGCGCRTHGARGRGDGAGWVALGLAAAYALRKRRR